MIDAFILAILFAWIVLAHLATALVHPAALIELFLFIIDWLHQTVRHIL